MYIHIIVLPFFYNYENTYIQNTLREEIQLYRSYLAEAEKEERQRELELDSLLSVEVEQQWAKRAAQWRTEKEARCKLMDDVMKIRRQQVEEKCEAVYSLEYLHVHIYKCTL